MRAPGGTVGPSRWTTGPPGGTSVLGALATMFVLASLTVACSASSTGTATGPSVAPGGTASGSTTMPVTGTITVSAAASLTASFTEIARDFEAENPGSHVELNLDSSGTLSRQILDGAPADVFASADQANMTTLTDAGLVVDTPQVFARNQLTIVVKKGNPNDVGSLADLASGGTVSLCGSDVPCGKYADQILAEAGITIPADRITRGQNVKATLAAVAGGDADVGIVYVTDVTGDAVEAVEIPDTQNAIATYPIGVVAASAAPATAGAFVAYVLSPRGQGVLRAAGFLAPST